MPVILTDLNRVRLLVGDTAQDLPYLADDTYTWLLETYAGNTNYILQAAVASLEMIINQIALSPQSIKTEEIQEVGPLVAALEKRLDSLKKQRDAKTTVARFPMLVKSDRADWDDLDNLFGKNTQYV